MITDDPNDQMPDKMDWKITLSGYVFGLLIIYLMFELALPATQIS